MMRNKPASSMQKTYDECYLICSTAIFFEGQNNEAEALRSWKSALDQINYHNAYRVSSSYTPKSETEKALYDSLKQMELQCKERVELLEALKQSREIANKDDSDSSAKKKKKDKGRSTATIQSGPPGSWLGGETIPPMQYSQIPNPGLAPPARPAFQSRGSNSSIHDKALPQVRSQPSPLNAPPKLPVPQKTSSRSPSPDHGRKTMRKTLRPEGRAPKVTTRAAANRTSRPAPMKAAGLAWDTHPRANSIPAPGPEYDQTIEARLSATAARRSVDQPRYEDPRANSYVPMPDPIDFIPNTHWRDTALLSNSTIDNSMDRLKLSPGHPVQMTLSPENAELESPPPPPPHATPINPVASKALQDQPLKLGKPPDISYRKEYLPSESKVAPSVARGILDKAYNQNPTEGPTSTSPPIHRKPAPPVPVRRTRPVRPRNNTNTDSDDDTKRLKARTSRPTPDRKESTGNITPPSTDGDSPNEGEPPKTEWEQRVDTLMTNLPKGVDVLAAKNILNEIVVTGDEVHWDDVAGLESAKKALKEAVVYPFLRPDLFMGLREPARGMLLFGPPGTGKTMLARAVATESKSTFFAISASSLTSKWHGESEKLVRALFALAKALAPSIIFVDEIDSLLSSRGGGSEHEASRRSKTEFLIQWSDLQRAAAGRDTGMGDASRVLVLAATNCPWDIDEAARRRFVRRQYIPLPELDTRETQLRTLLAAQKHGLSDRDIKRLVRLTDGYSGSDITALAKDAAMGPLRNLGEALLYTPMDQIRPIQMSDFVASLESIRPSVSKKDLGKFEEWASDYGERGG